MTKVKVVRTGVGGSNKTTASGNTTPKISKGKIQKIRFTDDEQKDDYINKYFEIQSKTRLCFVNIKRITSISSTVSSSLQAQCKVVGNNDKSSLSPTVNQSTIASAKKTSESFTGRKNRNFCNDDVESPPIDKTINVELTSPNALLQKESSDSLKESNYLVKPMPNVCHQGNKANVPERKCLVKLRKMSMLQNTSPVESGTDTSSAINYIESIKVKEKSQASCLKRKCRIKLHKLSMLENIPPAEELSIIKEKENDFSSASLSQTANPIIDQEKRNAFKKLSLNVNHANNIASRNKTNDTMATSKNNKTEMIANNETISNKMQHVMDMNKFHSVPQLNSTIHFEHVRNSTLRENNGNEATISKQTGTERNSSNTNNNKNLGNTSTASHTINRSHKFFHRHETESSNKSHNKQLPGHQTLLSRRSSQVWREKVYDFLSQSQTSDSDLDFDGKRVKSRDPTADIIKKLIKEGKVTVATNQKGKGRPRIKPFLTKKTNKVRKLQSAKNDNTKKANSKQTVNQNVVEDILSSGNKPEKERIDNDHEYFDNNIDDDITGTSLDYGLNKPDNPRQVKKDLQHHVTDHEGTFSNLAKSVLMSQTGRTNADRLKAHRLLAMAKKLISTPKNNKVPSIQTGMNTDFSPIVLSHKRPATKSSPWRVDEDAHLPKVFNFSRCSANLPSFSSDFIPPTPRKANPKGKSLQMSNEMSKDRLQLPESSPLPMMEEIPSVRGNLSTPFADEENCGVVSSFSSNDSNEENKSPPKSGPNKETDKNTNIFDLKQLPNPRRTLNYRSPLKAINILDVVHLPPIQNLKTIVSKQKEIFELENIAEKDTFKTPQKTKQKLRTKSPANNLFGFEEFLSQSELSSQESDVDRFTEQQHNSVKEKLHSLRKLRPNSCEFDIRKQMRTNVNNVPNIFIDVEHSSKPQKSIKEMLCSTLIEQPSTSKRSLEELKERNLKERRAFDCVAESNISELFNDPDPETTFNEENPHRTYIRPYKRKRRLRENKVVLIFDSDASEDEHDSSAENKKRDHHQGHEDTDTSSEQPQKKKRQLKEKPELKQFVEEFTEMCKEVDSYQLIVEKSA